MSSPQPLVLAGAASLTAGVVHAVAAGAHGDHRQAALLFTALAVVQVAWGALALARRSSAVPGVLLGLGALAGWVVAKTAGLPVDGLEAAEPVQLADATAAVLAAVSATAAAVRRPLPVAPALVGVCALGLLGATSTSGHEHAGSATHARHADAVPYDPVPYDPALPIDLGGTPGVTPQQQAAAENLVATTVSRLPQWADAGKAERAGFRSIGDGFTGTEHLINQEFLTDDVVLDPDRPESLVYDTSQGGRRLVAAMYMLQPGTTLEQVPDVGGPLVQWHTHEDLCFTPAGRVAGITHASGDCAAGLVRPPLSPMVHVWITPHRCGPFAALEGIAGGQVPEGETRLCDHAHGARG